MRDRDPPVSGLVVRAFLNIHVANRCPNVNCDIFSEYQLNGMSSAQNFIETRIDQLYRMLIFFMELQTHGIQTKKDDTYDGPLPRHVIHEGLQKVIFNNDAYSIYLLSLKRKCLPKTDGQEDDLVPYFSTFIKVRAADIRNSNTTVTTTASSTTPEYDPRFERDGTLLVNDMGISFCKRPRTEGLEHIFWSSDKNFGYAVTDSDQHLIFLKEDLTTFSKILGGFHKSFGGPQNIRSLVSFC